MTKEKNLRLFIGIPLTGGLKTLVSQIVDAIDKDLSGVRWVPKDNLHVTVKFLGRCSEMIVPGLLDTMGKIKELLPLSLIVGGIRGFPSSSSAKVIWVGTEDSKEKLRKIYK
ncbi:MAG: RNA 2',3'-cyclic phosphodiesterase, partial [Actinomycetota bacterium]|nr:RNA 2',3'-cyclic phosphodiesterase [Actinomycetota bacterium]